MSDQNPSTMQPPITPPEVQSYTEIWAEGIRQILQQISGITFVCSSLPAQDLANFFQQWSETGQWGLFGATKHAVGAQAFLIPPSTAVRFGQLLMGEPLDETAELNDDYRDALEELLRQFAGAAASEWKGRLGKEVAFPFGGSGNPNWSPSFRHGFELTSPESSPLHIGLLIDGNLAVSLKSIFSANFSAGQPEPPPVSATAGSDNLGMILDIELPTALRFGHRRLDLREVLEFSPGFVVELEQAFEQTAELVVAGRVVARGKVVLVDGNYGVQLTEIAGH